MMTRPMLSMVRLRAATSPCTSFAAHSLSNYLSACSQRGRREGRPGVLQSPVPTRSVTSAKRPTWIGLRVWFMRPCSKVVAACVHAATQSSGAVQHMNAPEMDTRFIFDMQAARAVLTARHCGRCLLSMQRKLCCARGRNAAVHTCLSTPAATRRGTTSPCRC
jgi:hypothetical protein